MSSKLKDLESYWSLRTNSESELIEQGILLARENQALKLELQKQKLEVEELDNLRKLANLPKIRGYRYETARVTKRDLTSWWQEITIRKGENYGIKKDSPVVFSGGVVGKIKEVHARTSTVTLITSRNFRMAARFEDDPRPVTYIGSVNASFRKPKGIVRDAPSDILVSSDKPQILISSDLGSIFPSGLRIGKVHFMEPGTNGLFKTGQVLLDPELLYIHEVSVLVPNE